MKNGLQGTECCDSCDGVCPRCNWPEFEIRLERVLARADAHKSQSCSRSEMEGMEPVGGEVRQQPARAVAALLS